MNLLALFQRTSHRRSHPELTPLQERIGYHFRDPELLLTGLRHRSWLGQHEQSTLDSNERLEFLGDAVLDLCVADHLFRRREESKEGELTQFKSIIVSGKFLVGKAREIELGSFLLLSESEERTGGRDRESILEDSFEALIGAIYLDGGIRAARRFVDDFVLEGISLREVVRKNQNYKSQLLELSQHRNLGSPTYRVIEEIGPDHNKFFVVEVRLGERAVGKGTGSSKKKAEQQAARAGLRQLGVRREEDPGEGEAENGD